MLAQFALNYMGYGDFASLLGVGSSALSGLNSGSIKNPNSNSSFIDSPIQSTPFFGSGAIDSGNNYWLS